MTANDPRPALGLRPVINVSGTMTSLGASIVVPEFKVTQAEHDLVAAVKDSARRIEARLGRPADAGAER